MRCSILNDESRPEGCNLAETIGCQLRTILNGFGVVIVVVLVDTKLTSHVFLIQDRCAPQTSNDAQCVYERLPATEGHVCLDVEEVVGRPMRLAVYRCAIGQRQVDEWCMDATEQGSVVCQIAPAYRDRRIEGYLKRRKPRARSSRTVRLRR